jgi:hypothetical protein
MKSNLFLILKLIIIAFLLVSCGESNIFSGSTDEQEVETVDFVSELLDYARNPEEYEDNLRVLKQNQQFLPLVHQWNQKKYSILHMKLTKKLL